ncbi:MAG: cytochrome P460 family protein [Pseudomonadota bacterium]|nr:cytochrome P460 family protein [Pseudomonadota bacterium]
MNYLKPALALAIAALVEPAAAADVEAGKAKAQQVCAACHGANGVSVSDTIPNLAGQKEKYISAQLKAFKDGKRKNAMMNAIAPQLKDDDVANLAAFFSGLTGATGTAKSDLLADVTRTSVKFPENYADSFKPYTTINFEDRKQVRVYYANPVALKAAKEGKDLPDGSYLLVEVYAAKLDADKKPIKGADGYYEREKLAFWTAMSREPGWGKEIPDILRNEDWNYAVINLDKTIKGGVNQAECLACHKPLDKESYTFTLKQLKEVASK